MHDVSDRSGHICPECGAPRESGSSPTCECARRAADELLQTRSAETAAAEDFDPLRIRPYVDLEVHAEGTGAGPVGGPPPPTATAVGQDPADRATISIPLQRTSSDDLPSAPSDTPPDTGRRRRFVLVGAGATAVVVAAAGFAGGLFSYEAPSRNGAAPDDIRASVPDTAVDEPSPSDSASSSASESASASASADESPTPSDSGSPSDSATPSSRTSATTRAPAPDNSASAAPPSAAPTDKAGPAVLRRGDQGPEVTELQLRLKQLALYVGDADGDYDNRTENAVRTYQFTRGLDEEQGVYTEKTRTHLESETTTP
ncbi:peptidoglycan-binding domain-containing protein [Streptomyces kroppenstedtii]|uniref:peptidoglycan-binding domain-containing protein n=1 Tax=Streptomyces kroppenstedtii TaxID=3051181 RepID=UPI0028D67956|nr:peptidoglycan-binding domain-containing protein [Streptomyces sp. DSM 40484]